MITRAELAARLDHTLLAPEATPADIERLCAEGIELGVGAVCVSPTMVATAIGCVGSALHVCAVIGFPSGAHRPGIKAAEARLAESDGAVELDMVVDLGSVKRHDWVAVAADIAAVRADTGGILKVIVESAALTADELDLTARTAVASGADLLKTSTGFHPTGGATLEAVSALAAIAAASDPAPSGSAVGVKASGGIRDAGTALAMLGAGATRIGCSASRAILDGLDELAATS